MNKYILCCSCFGVEKRAKEAFGLLTHGQKELPEIVKGRDRIYKLGKRLSSPHVIALSKLTGKFAYYIQLGQNNVITEEYDLLRGARIA